ncbi:hypothetical protein CBOM_02538 [Ceraceosorus bombacis]|uniref:Retrotransposon gag domain n=1 Tax=Ceraceosorus bombacis TaxID=401625 RepID=A0A0N7L9T9_9BASI|nr:hypothetical protein CBOM_02538 [Ceraceosorus bombacis]
MVRNTKGKQPASGAADGASDSRAPTPSVDETSPATFTGRRREESTSDEDPAEGNPSGSGRTGTEQEEARPTEAPQSTDFRLMQLESSTRHLQTAIYQVIEHLRTPVADVRASTAEPGRVCNRLDTPLHRDIRSTRATSAFPDPDMAPRPRLEDTLDYVPNYLPPGTKAGTLALHRLNLPTFAGKPKKLEGFILKCERQFSFTNVPRGQWAALAMNQLEGRPDEMFTSQWRAYHVRKERLLRGKPAGPAFETGHLFYWGDFCSHLCTMFAGRNTQVAAMEKLKSMRLTGLFDQYVADFQTNANLSGIVDKKMLLLFFTDGLPSDLLSELGYARDWPLTQYIREATRAEQARAERQRRMCLQPRPSDSLSRSRAIRTALVASRALVPYAGAKRETALVRRNDAGHRQAAGPAEHAISPVKFEVEEEDAAESFDVVDANLADNEFEEAPEEFPEQEK